MARAMTNDREKWYRAPEPGVFRCALLESVAQGFEFFLETRTGKDDRGGSVRLIGGTEQSGGSRAGESWVTILVGWRCPVELENAVLPEPARDQTGICSLYSGLRLKADLTAYSRLHLTYWLFDGQGLVS